MYCLNKNPKNLPAAIGLEALVPVCDLVHLPCKSVVTTFLSPNWLLEPEL